MPDHHSAGTQDPDALPSVRPASIGGAALVDHLGTDECWALLRSVALGRLAMTEPDGTPTVYPVNYVVHDEALYFRSTRDAKLALIAERPTVALEIDGEDDAARWSVIVKATAAQLGDRDEIDASGVLDLESASPTRKVYVVKLTPAQVTGRRFPKGTGRVEPRPDPTLSTQELAIQRRDTRPQPIPSLPPIRRSRRS